MDVKTSIVGSAVKPHSRYLTEKDAEAARSVERWRAATRISLVVLLAGSTLQLYLMHVYATIAALPALGIGMLH